MRLVHTARPSLYNDFVTTHPYRKREGAYFLRYSENNAHLLGTKQAAPILHTRASPPLQRVRRARARARDGHEEPLDDRLPAAQIRQRYPLVRQMRLVLSRAQPNSAFTQ